MEVIGGGDDDGGDGDDEDDDGGGDADRAMVLWRWSIEASFDGYGPTICYIALQIGGQWRTDAAWKVIMQGSCASLQGSIVSNTRHHPLPPPPPPLCR